MCGQQHRMVFLHNFFFLRSYLIYFFGHVTCGILVAWLGIQPTGPAVEVQSLNHCLQGSSSPQHFELDLWAKCKIQSCCSPTENPPGTAHCQFSPCCRGFAPQTLATQTLLPQSPSVCLAVICSNDMLLSWESWHSLLRQDGRGSLLCLFSWPFADSSPGPGRAGLLSTCVCPLLFICL